MGMAASIKDVARIAGVSIATVSRVLSGKPGVSSETAERIHAIIKEVGYRPHLGARGLVQQRSGNIAIVFPRGTHTLSNPFFSTILSGAANVLDSKEYNMVLSFTPQQKKRLFETQSVDGILLFSPRSDEIDLDWLKGSRLPIVVVGSYLPESPFVCVRQDDVDGVRQAVVALYEAGHRNIGLINGPLTSAHSQNCLTGYMLGLTECGLPRTTEFAVEVSEFDPVLARDVVSQYLRANNDISGIVCSSDYLALGAMKAAASEGISVPQHLSVIGLDDVPTSTLISPTLSSVSVDLVQMGKRAAQVLIELIDGNKNVDSEIVFPMNYIRRETTVPPQI